MISTNQFLGLGREIPNPLKAAHKNVYSPLKNKRKAKFESSVVRQLASPKTSYIVDVQVAGLRQTDMGVRLETPIMCGTASIFDPDRKYSFRPNSSRKSDSTASESEGKASILGLPDGVLRPTQKGPIYQSARKASGGVFRREQARASS